MDRRENKSLAMLVLSMFIFGTIGIFRRYIPLPSGIIAFARGSIGAAFLLLLMKAKGKKLFRDMDAKKALWLIVSGAVMGINWILLFEAYNYTTVSIATLCYYMEPTFVMLASTVVFRERLTVKKSVCMVISLIGMVMVSGVIGNRMLQAEELKGIMLGLGAAVLYSAVVLMNKKAIGIDPYEKSMVQLAASAVALIPYLLFIEGFSGIVLDSRIVVMLIVIGVLHTGISYALYFGSMDKLNTQTIAIFSYIDPVIALFLSAVILSEKMGAVSIVGSVLILGTAIYSELKIESEPKK